MEKLTIQQILSSKIRLAYFIDMNECELLKTAGVDMAGWHGHGKPVKLWYNNRGTYWSMHEPDDTWTRVEVTTESVIINNYSIF